MTPPSSFFPPSSSSHSSSHFSSTTPSSFTSPSSPSAPNEFHQRPPAYNPELQIPKYSPCYCDRIPLEEYQEEGKECTIEELEKLVEYVYLNPSEAGKTNHFSKLRNKQNKKSKLFTFYKVGKALAYLLFFPFLFFWKLFFRSKENDEANDLLEETNERPEEKDPKQNRDTTKQTQQANCQQQFYKFVNVASIFIRLAANLVDLIILYLLYLYCRKITILIFGMSVLYIMLMFWGRTLGKFICGIYVANQMNERSISFVPMLIREVLVILFGWNINVIFYFIYRTMLHDVLMETMILRT